MGSRTLPLSTGDVEVEIIRSSRRTVALYVRPGGSLLIRAPWFVPGKILMAFAAEKTKWIERQLQRLKNVAPAGAPLAVIDGGIVPFMGRDLKVVVRQGPRRSVVHDEGSLILTIPGPGTSGELARLTESWYLREARKYLIQRTLHLAEICSSLLPQPSAVNIRKMKRRWGTCHTGGAIWLNRELIKKDPELIDYVIIHELCHLVHHNHGREYYELLGKIMPGYRELRRRLQQ